MSKFKVGDRVIVTTDEYSITKLGWKGIVKEADRDIDPWVDVIPLEVPTKDDRYAMRDGYGIHSKHLELIDPPIDDSLETQVRELRDALDVVRSQVVRLSKELAKLKGEVG